MSYIYTHMYVYIYTQVQHVIIYVLTVYDIYALQTSPQRTVFVAPPISFVASPNEDFGAERCPDFRLGPAAFAGPIGWTQIPSWCRKGKANFDVKLLPIGYGSIPLDTIFSGMNIHLPAILMYGREVTMATGSFLS